MTEKNRWIWIELLAVVLLVALDQWTKWLAVLHLKGQEPFAIWDGVFELAYLENRGAAFGMLQGQKVFFLVSTLLVLALLMFYYHRMPLGRRFYPARLIVILLEAGAIGNLIDRVVNSYVVDFFYFKLIDFPVFNVADIYVTVGGALLVIFFLFYYKDEDLEFLNLRKRDGRKENS